MHKTGQPVYVPMPDVVVKALEGVEGDGDYLF